MNERFKPVMQPEQHERPNFEQVHDAAMQTVLHELYARHSKKIYHNPSHTVGYMEREVSAGVLNSMAILRGTFAESFSHSLKQIPPEENNFPVMSLGMEAGMMAHDVVIEIDGVSGSGMVMRRRGWKEGGNEYESFRFYQRKFIEQYYKLEEGLSDKELASYQEELEATNPQYVQYMQSVEETIAGTDPDAMQFQAEVPHEYIAQGNFSKAVRDILMNPVTCAYNIMMIDSKKANDSLESLFGSSADLATAAIPDRFLHTGNAEFWELQYQVAKDVVSFLDNPAEFPRENAVKILVAMKQWRLLQPGVALGQKVRLERNYTEDNIRTLFEKKFSVTPLESDVRDFVGKINVLTARVDTSIEESAQFCQEFSQKFSIPEKGETSLTQEEIALLTEAIVLMGGEVDALRRYVSHVDEELGKPKPQA